MDIYASNPTDHHTHIQSVIPTDMKELDIHTTTTILLTHVNKPSRLSEILQVGIIIPTQKEV